MYFSDSMQQEAEQLLIALRKRRWQLATAESCTGGLLSALITEIAGASDVFAGGIVSYANHIKQSSLGVKEETLSAHGAVSAETALEMANGALIALGTDISVSITGIAGPAGGSAEKPVGTVHLAIASRTYPPCQEKHLFPGNRQQVREQAMTKAIAMLIRYCNQ